MPNIASAKKALTQSTKRQQANTARRSALKTAIKKLLVAVEAKEHSSSLDTMLRGVAAQLSRASSKKVIKKIPLLGL